MHDTSIALTSEAERASDLLHDYHDIVEYNDGKSDLKTFEHYVSGKLGAREIWVSEAGVELYNGGEPTALRDGTARQQFGAQNEAAQHFLALHEVRSGQPLPRVERVYYYSYHAPKESKVVKEPDAFDSGLVEAAPEEYGKGHGEVRPAYCVLAYSNHRCPFRIEEVPGSHAQRVKIETHGYAANITSGWRYDEGEEHHKSQAVEAGLSAPVEWATEIQGAGCVFPGVEANTVTYRVAGLNSAGESSEIRGTLTSEGICE